MFADIQYETGNLDAVAAVAKISARTKAIMPVHWAGNPCDMDEFLGIAQSHGLVIIEDAAHALGSTYRGKPIGSISDYTCFSFQAIKHVTTGDGGAVCMLDCVKRKSGETRETGGSSSSRYSAASSAGS